jgi:hypothetical protein
MESLVQKANSGFPFLMAELHYILPFNMSFIRICVKLKRNRDIYLPFHSCNLANSARGLDEPGYF